MEKLTQLNDLIKEKKQDQEERQYQKERNKNHRQKGQLMEREDEWNCTRVCKISKAEEKTTWCANSTAETVQNWEQKTKSGIRRTTQCTTQTTGPVQRQKEQRWMVYKEQLQKLEQEHEHYQK